MDGLQSGYTQCTGAKKSLARTWNLIGSVCDHCFIEAADKTIWMPSHGAKHTIGVVLASNGLPVTPLMWRANRLVDLAAKHAAGSDRVDKWIIPRVRQWASFARFQGANLGHVTYLANNHKVTEIGDGGATVEYLKRDSTGCKPPKVVPREGDLVEVDSEFFKLVVAGGSQSQSVQDATQTQQVRGHTLGGRRASLSAARRESQLYSLKEQQSLRQWIDGKALKPADGPTATDRLQRLRDRILNRDLDS